jgi:hypothetical protein
MRAIVANTSWDKTANAMQQLIQTTEPANKAQRLTAHLADVAAAGAGNVSPLPVKQAAPAVDVDQQPIKAQAAE